MLIKNVNIATPPNLEKVTGKSLDTLEIRLAQDIEIAEGKIRRIRPSSDGEEAGDWAIPAFTDPHTHIVFCGSREDEIDLRKRVGYEGVLKSGGGIYSTVAATKRCDFEDLLAQSRERMVSVIRNGTAVLECKTGYGLDLETEEKSIRVMEALEKELGITIRKTLLAHVPPRGVSENAFLSDFKEMIEEFRRRIDYVDVFVDEGAFTPDFAYQAIAFSNSLGIPGRVHLNELKNLGGVSRLKGLKIASFDHMVETREMETGEIGTAVTLLPYTAMLLGKKLDIFNALKARGITVAIGSDSSPNTYITSLPFVISIARQFTPLTLENLLNMATINSSYTLSLSSETGSIHEGKRANIIVTRGSYRNIGYRFGDDLIRTVLVDGKPRLSETDLSH
ncbi:MAG: amidohydrolase family protein [Thermoplasmata archaeon]